jgi:hypothetical protein
MKQAIFLIKHHYLYSIHTPCANIKKSSMKERKDMEVKNGYLLSLIEELKRQQRSSFTYYSSLKNHFLSKKRYETRYIEN